MKERLFITGEDFETLKGSDETAVERLFAPIAHGLISFLNERSCVCNLQARRSKWATPNEDAAFADFKPDPEHWYMFNRGGRNEAQLNIGMFPSHVRVGLGFEFTEKEFGAPQEVTAAFTRFSHAVRAESAGFRKLVNDVPLEMEFPADQGAASHAGLAIRRKNPEISARSQDP